MIRIRYNPKKNKHKKPPIELTIPGTTTLPGYYKISQQQARMIFDYYCEDPDCICFSGGLVVSTDEDFIDVKDCEILATDVG